jgi:hypothetical protein
MAVVMAGSRAADKGAGPILLARLGPFVQCPFLNELARIMPHPNDPELFVAAPTQRRELTAARLSTGSV